MHLIILLILHEWSNSKNDIYEFLNTLDIHSGSGPDGVSPVFLKNRRNVFINPLYYIFNKSLKMYFFQKFGKIHTLSVVIKQIFVTTDLFPSYQLFLKCLKLNIITKKTIIRNVPKFSW